MTKKEDGPVKILCTEIGAIYTPPMESMSVFVSFVSILVDEVADIIATRKVISDLTGEKITTETDDALSTVRRLLAINDRDQLIQEAEKAHLFVSVPDEGPCNHYIDMLSSCVGALRFGLELPCASRHAAAATDHIWKRKYGISLFDSYSAAWGKTWATAKFYESLVRREVQS